MICSPCLQSLIDHGQSGIFTDGVYRRGFWLADLADIVEGFVPDCILLKWHGTGGGIEGSTARVVGVPLRQRRRLTAYEVAFLKARTEALLHEITVRNPWPRAAVHRDGG